MSSRVFIIAEAGVNHNGDINKAKKMIDLAKEAGVDAVKFQTFNSKKLVVSNAPKAKYQEENTGNKEENQYDMLKKLELSVEDHIELINYCKKKNIMFMSAAFDLDSIDLLNDLGIEIFKIPSGEINNFPYLRKIGMLRKKVILSTGMSTMEEIKEAINVLERYGTRNIQVLHCNTQYPTPLEDVNLRAIRTMKMELAKEIGYSDHTLGIEVPIGAVAMGARIIEKHFTLDKNMEGPDHKASLNPYELKAMVKSIRNMELALGNDNKVVTKSEEDNIKIARKSIVAAKKINKGEILSEDNLIVKRPGTGINPMKWEEIIGRVAVKDFNEDELIIL